MRRAPLRPRGSASARRSLSRSRKREELQAADLDAMCRLYGADAPCE
ncbi:MAG: hypothetical protein AAGF12_11620 [Myxococcota bacterium]